jgi:L-asparaginase II
MPGLAHDPIVPDPIVIEVTRSGVVESWHHGRAAGLDGAGALAVNAGAVDQPVFGRSANKPLQAAAMVRAGLDLPSHLLALVAASHSGEAVHLAGVRQILDSVGLDESALGNAPALPLDEACAEAVVRSGGGPSSLLQNCSGKHAGMLVTCAAAGWPTDGYLEPAHPLQRHITAVVAELAGEPVAHVGVDGCGAPVHALSLVGLASAFRAVGSAPPGTAERQVGEAMRMYPELVGGTGRRDTKLMQLLPGVIAKDGAEGVRAMATSAGEAVALKVTDGARRGRVPFALAVLDALGIDVTPAAELRTETIYGGERPVGEVRSAWTP